MPHVSAEEIVESRNRAYPTNSRGTSESISKKNFAWSAAERSAAPHSPPHEAPVSTEKSVIPAACARAYRPPLPTIDQHWVAALLSDTLIIGYRKEAL